MATKGVPEGYRSIAPYLTVDGAEQAIEFYEQAFGAKERGRMQSPDGKIAHAELELGDSVLMLSDPFPQFVTKTPRELGGTSASIMPYVEDVPPEEMAKRAEAAMAAMSS